MPILRMNWGLDTEWEDDMESGDMLVSVVCGILVAGMGILAFWSEHGGRDKDSNETEDRIPEDKSDDR